MIQKWQILLVFFTCSLNAQIINFPDPALKNALVNTLCVDSNDPDNNPESDADSNNDGEIEVSEALAIIKLYIEDQNIVSLEGLSYFANLEVLIASYNQISSFTGFEFNNLRILDLFFNQLAAVDIQNLPALVSFNIVNNPVTVLDLHLNANLKRVDCSNTLIETIDLCGTNVDELFAQYNPNLTTISVKNNVISDASGPDRMALATPPDFSFLFNGCPLLGSICYDEGELDEVLQSVDTPETLVLTTDCMCQPLAVVAQTPIDAVAIYPNPATDTLTIHVNAEMTIQTILIFNRLGQKIIDTTLTTIDVSQLPAGTYFLKLITQNGQKTQKFIKL